MNPLETICRPLLRLVNREIAAKTPARELCAELDGAVIAVRLRDSALAMYFFVLPDQLDLSADYDEEPDVAITGSLIGLTRLAVDGGEAAIRDGSVVLSGDAELAQKFSRLLAWGRPDLEEELSHVVGDAAAHGIGEFARSIGDWGRQAGETISQNLGEYLTEESRAVPGRYEVDRFRSRVETLRDDVARFEARLKRAEADLAGH